MATVGHRPDRKPNQGGVRASSGSKSVLGAISLDQQGVDDIEDLLLLVVG